MITTANQTHDAHGNCGLNNKVRALILIDVEGPGLRIADQIFKLLQINKLQARRVSLIYHSFPFFTVFYRRLLLFLATYWPLGKIGS